MPASQSIWRIGFTLVVVVGLLVACGGPEGAGTPTEVQATTPPTEAPQEEEATEAPAAAPTDEEPEPTTPPTEVPAEEQPEEAPPAADGAALLEERCTACHGLDRTTSARKNREEWERTVIRMVSKGAELDDEEQEILITYLTETYGP